MTIPRQRTMAATSSSDHTPSRRCCLQVTQIIALSDLELRLRQRPGRWHRQVRDHQLLEWHRFLSPAVWQRRHLAANPQRALSLGVLRPHDLYSGRSVTFMGTGPNEEAVCGEQLVDVARHLHPTAIDDHQVIANALEVGDEVRR